MPACNRARRIGQVVRILTPWPGTRDIPEEFFTEANGPTKIGVIQEVKRAQDLPTRYVIKTADGETHTLTRDKFATSAIPLDPINVWPLGRSSSRKGTPPAPKPRIGQHSRPRKRQGNFAEVARIKEASK